MKRKRVKLETRVKRDGKLRLDQLRPGDHLKLELPDQVDRYLMTPVGSLSMTGDLVDVLGASGEVIHSGKADDMIRVI